MLDLYIKIENGDNFHRYNFSWISCFSYKEVAVALDNLERMRLIEIPFGESYTKDYIYDLIRNTSAYKEHKEELEKMNVGNVNEIKKHIRKTALADLFYEVCLKD